MTKDLPYKGIHAFGKLLYHLGVALDVVKHPAIE